MNHYYSTYIKTLSACIVTLWKLSSMWRTNISNCFVCVCLCQVYNLPIWMVLCTLKPFMCKCHLEADYTQNSFQVNDHIYRTCACTTNVITLKNQSENLGKKKWLKVNSLHKNITLCHFFKTTFLHVLWHYISDFLRPSSLYKIEWYVNMVLNA